MTEIYFATNRNMKSKEGAPGVFGKKFNTDNPCYYRVGKASVPRIKNPKNKWSRSHRVDPASVKVFPERAQTKQNLKEKLGSSQMFSEIREQLLTEDGARDVILFIHGFASSLDTALERASQLKDAYLSPPNKGGWGKPDMSATKPRKPIVICFSWPSDEKSFGMGTANDGAKAKWAYFSDKDDAAASGKAIARSFLRMLQQLAALEKEEKCNQRIHLVVHSMGTFALSHALQALKAETRGGRLARCIENAFIMAADEDAKALSDKKKLQPVIELARQVHIYHAHNDGVLSISDLTKFNSDRLGEYGPVSLSDKINRVYSIDCSDVSETTFLHQQHQYYRLRPEVIADVRAVLRGERHDRIEGRKPVEFGRSYRIAKGK